MLIHRSDDAIGRRAIAHPLVQGEGYAATRPIHCKDSAARHDAARWCSDRQGQDNEIDNDLDTEIGKEISNARTVWVGRPGISYMLIRSAPRLAARQPGGQV